MDDYREFQEKAAEKSRTLIQKENMLVGTRLDRMNETNRPEGYDEQKYSVASVQSAITTVDRLLNLPQSKLWLSDMDRYQLRLRQNRDKSHVLLNAHKFVGDSTRMSRVKDALEQADALYNTALEKCQDYIEHKNPWFSKGKERLRMVKEAKERLIQERVQLTEAKTILEDDAGAFAQETCIRDVLLKGQAKINTKKTDANTPAPENLKWSDFGAILRGELNGFVTFSGTGLTDATSDSETIENRKVKERLVELVKESIGKNKNGSYLISKDLEVRIRARLGIDNAAFESAPLSKVAVKEIRDMVAEEDSLVTSILRGPSAWEKEKSEENAPMIRQALAKTVDRYIGTKLDAVSLSNTQEERVENTREELVSIIEKAGQYVTKVTALTQEQLDKVVMYDTGKLRDMLFSQLEDVYTMATIISGDHMTYKGIANQKQLIIPIAALLISKVATQENPLDALVNDTEFALKKRELAFTMAADAQRRKRGEEKEQLIERVEKMKIDVENMALLQELSCMGSKGLDDLVNQSDLNQNDPDLKDGIKNLKILAENLRKLKEFENSALQPSSYWKSEFQVALEDFGKKAEKLRAANVTEQYETLLQEFRSFQEQNPNAAKEELEEKKRALFDEYKKVQEVHFMIVGPLSNAVEMLTEMGAQFWERKESGGKEEPSFIEKELQPLFDDKDCKGDELQQCYNAYVDAIKPLEKRAKRQKWL